jgi:kanosamine-6-phosphate phosphatase
MKQGVYHSTKKTDFLLFSDFDETYFPHECNGEQLLMLQELENYLESLSQDHHVKIGWVTGSSLQQLQQKMQQAKLRYFPHFVSSNLGTEIWEIDPDGGCRSILQWDQRLSCSGFSQRLIEEILIELKNVYGITLHPQTQFRQQTYKMNYYYYITSDAIVDYHLSIIKQLAFIHGVALNINRCNSKAGDPDNAYDVDFIPLGTGKQAVVEFMRDYYQVPFQRTLAFGDSGNDICMLKSVKYGYLLNNATPEAKSLHDLITQTEYGRGIIEVCEEVFKQHKVIN